ncbi:glyoxalase superfamily protein [Roseicyclus persicicus]|uniref:Glyoxalase-related protein domain-containing protein n=1 Tax=Roseicyclus persicicus TaxID=2650661 RepID=A0A7X6GYR4_9RHOB|nr:glyoxalase superfamily protein [Roseibacterium persicicum]NKX43973.1 hypothetical protein [Roseibacterium persicicum]
MSSHPTHHTDGPGARSRTQPDLPTLAEAKAAAKRLREERLAAGQPLAHGTALDIVAQAHGFRDWNAMAAAIHGNGPEGWQAGARVTGRYLSQPFSATVLAVEALRPGWVRLVLDLDEAVDVVTFASFSNFRKRVRVDVGPAGHSHERTSDGIPHLVLDR